MSRQKLKVAVATKNPEKCAVVKEVFQKYLPIEIEILPYDIASGVSPTPTEEEMYQGCLNRIQGLTELEQGFHFLVALESALIERFSQLTEECLCMVKDTTTHKLYWGISSTLLLPRMVTTRIAETRLIHAEVMQAIRRERDIPESYSDTWGTYTGGILERRISFTEAVRNGLIPHLQSPKSLYTE